MILRRHLRPVLRLQLFAPEREQRWRRPLRRLWKPPRARLPSEASEQASTCCLGPPQWQHHGAVGARNSRPQETVRCRTWPIAQVCLWLPGGQPQMPAIEEPQPSGTSPTFFVQVLLPPLGCAWQHPSPLAAPVLGPPESLLLQQHIALQLHLRRWQHSSL